MDSKGYLGMIGLMIIFIAYFLTIEDCSEEHAWWEANNYHHQKREFMERY